MKEIDNLKFELKKLHVTVDEVLRRHQKLEMQQSKILLPEHLEAYIKILNALNKSLENQEFMRNFLQQILMILNPEGDNYEE